MDKQWSVTTRVAARKRWLTRKRSNRLQIVKLLKPGKQGSVTLVRDRALQLDAVAKKTVFQTAEHRRAVREFNEKKRQARLQAEGLIEQKVWEKVNALVMGKKCPNFVLMYEKDFADDFRSITTYSEVWDRTLHVFSHLPHINITEQAWVSIFFQICVALLTFHDAGIRHQDLHGNNVFMKALPKNSDYWTYKVDGKTYYCPNKGFMAAVSDYGRALSPALKTRSSFQSYIDTKLDSTHQFYDLQRIYESIERKTRRYGFFKNILFSKEEKQTNRPLAKIIPRIFHMYQRKPLTGKNIDTFVVGRR